MATNVERFVFVKAKASFTSELQSKYSDCIVFIKDTNEIYTHGKFFGVKGENAISVTEAEGKISLKLNNTGANITLSQSADGLSANIDEQVIKDIIDSYLTSGEGITYSNGEISVTDGYVEGVIDEYLTAGEGISIEKGVITNTFSGKAGDGINISDDKTISVNPDNSGNVTVSVSAAGVKADIAEETITDIIDGYLTDGDGTVYSSGSFSVNPDNSGDVKLTVTAAGVKADVDPEKFKVRTVAAGDNILSVGENGDLNTTIGLTVSEGNLNITGINSAVVASASLSDIFKDKFVQSGSLSEDKTKIVLVLSDDEQTEIEIPVAALLNLNKVEKGTDGDYVTTTVTDKDENSNQTVSVSVTTCTIENASDSVDGLATAKDVKDNLKVLDWVEL